MKAALAGSIVAYLIYALAMQHSSSSAGKSPLLTISALVIAFLSNVVAYVALSMFVSPPIDKGVVLAAENRADAIAAMVAARKQVNDLLARRSLWWHYLLAVIGGVAFGVFLAVGISWLLA